MHPIARLLASLVAAAPLAAQNFVANGDFSAGLTAWTESGYSVSPGIETYDTTGLGADPCYACNPGGQVSPPPYQPNYIEQIVTVVPGIPYEFTADVAVTGNPTVNNADAGTLWVEVAGVEVTRLALGGYTAPLVQRARLCARFTSAAVGQQPLRIYFHRRFLTNAGTPRNRLDNVSLQFAIGPTFCLVGNRQLGQTRTVEARSGANEPVLFFLAPLRTSGLQIPGINGTWFLNLTRMFFFFTGATDNNGVLSFAMPLPTDPALLTAVMYVQGLGVTPTAAVNLGYDQFLTFVQ